MLKRLKQTVARVDIDGKPNGAAFLVGRRHVATALHVLDGHKKVKLIFVEWDKQDRERLAERIWRHPGFDLAVLELDQACPDAVEPLPWAATTPASRIPWMTFGFPAEVPDGHTLPGKDEYVSDPHRLVGEWELRILQLYTPTARFELSGFSGAPCVIGGAIVGVISHQLVRTLPDGSPFPKKPVLDKKPELDTLFALPIELLASGMEDAGITPSRGTWQDPGITTSVAIGLRQHVQRPLELDDAIMPVEEFDIYDDCMTASVLSLYKRRHYIHRSVVPYGMPDEDGLRTSLLSLLLQDENVLLLGDAGTGKTTQLIQLGHSLVSNCGRDVTFIQLRCYRGESLRAATTGSKNPVVLLDGWDEVDPLFKQTLIDEVNAIILSQIRIVVTSRPKTGCEGLVTKLAAYCLIPLNFDEVLDYLAQFPGQQYAKKLHQMLMGADRFTRQLATSPFLLQAMMVLSFYLPKLPSNPGSLLDEVVKRIPEVLRTESCELSIAWSTITITLGELAYMMQFKENYKPRLAEIGKWNVARGLPETLQSILHEAKRARLVISSGAQGEPVEFSNQMLAEYFAAMMWRHGRAKFDVDYDVFPGELFRRTYWRESLIMFTGLCGDANAFIRWFSGKIVSDPGRYVNEWEKYIYETGSTLYECWRIAVLCDGEDEETRRLVVSALKVAALVPNPMSHACEHLVDVCGSSSLPWLHELLEGSSTENVMFRRIVPQIGRIGDKSSLHVLARLICRTDFSGASDEHYRRARAWQTNAGALKKIRRANDRHRPDVAVAALRQLADPDWTYSESDDDFDWRLFFAREVAQAVAMILKLRRLSNDDRYTLEGLLASQVSTGRALGVLLLARVECRCRFVTWRRLMALVKYDTDESWFGQISKLTVRTLDLWISHRRIYKSYHLMTRYLSAHGAFKKAPRNFLARRHTCRWRR